MFGELLQRVLDETPGALAVTLMGFDGIAIESREAPEKPDTVKLQEAVIELGTVASELRRVSDGLGAGPVHEVMVQTDALITVLRTVADAYFVALSLRPDGNTGKGRYLLRITAPKLAAEL